MYLFWFIFDLPIKILNFNGIKAFNCILFYYWIFDYSI